MLGLLAGATQKIRLGLGVTNPYTRNPALLAMSAATMDVLSGGRFLLGLGRSERESIEGEMGIHYGSPLGRLEESVKSLRRLFRGESVTNPALGVKDITLKLRPRSGGVPIYLAASGPKALRLAGRIADGVLLNAYSPVNYVHYAVSEINAGIKESGRGPRDVDVACVLIPRMTDDLPKVMGAMKKRIALLLTEPFTGQMLLDKSGLEATFLSGLRKLMVKGETEASANLIPDELARAFYVAGSETECRKRIGEYRRAGIALPVLLPQLSQFGEVARRLWDA